ncbi:hypothetical protein F5884DRAFT_114522 [Xylogone sp. PMI_703]|nr:hypothetical protein F5884DRAFT_114522 [Xylogone sp. PMI_703]
MADPIGIASGLLALATFAFQSSTTLYQTIQSYRFHPRNIRDLQEELEALSGVLSSLTETINNTTDVDLSALDLPLRRCGNACKEFQDEILKCSSRSGGNRTSFRDWAKLRYMGDNVDSFRQLLSGYKTTISIALADANLRKSAITPEGLEIYRGMLRDATDDLEAHLESIDEKLQTVLGRSVTNSDSDAAELRLIREERMSTQKCLQICSQLSEHIDQIQVTSPRSDDDPENKDSDTLPEKLTIAGLQECKNSLLLTTAKLEGYMKDIINRMVNKSKTNMTSEEEHADLLRLRDEWETARQCVEICSKADMHLKENVVVTTIDNYATGDAVQFMVSTDGKTLYGKNKGLGWRSRQVGGHLSDASLQQLSRDMFSVHLYNSTAEIPPPVVGTFTAPDEGMENRSDSEFGGRYGPGVRLASKTGGNSSGSTPSPSR